MSYGDGGDSASRACSSSARSSAERAAASSWLRVAKRSGLALVCIVVHVHAAESSVATAQVDAGSAAPEVHPPVLLTAATADYPAAALSSRVEGSVVLRLGIDAQGTVMDAEVVEPAGYGFDEAARAAVLQFQFEPARRGDVASASSILYRYDFHLPPPPAESIPPPPPPPPPPPAAASVAVTEVLVRGRSQEQRLRESTEAVKVIETEEAQRHTADLGEVLARTEGVAVQRGGGLGSETRLSIHGLTDEQIRVFLDGVPLEFQGFGLGVSTVPLNWVERAEVYRGVVPVGFGADALGGAVNLVTDQNVRDATATASYTAGAFDTHQLALNASVFHEPTGVLARLAGFYDTSRNDYLIDVKVPDELGRLEPARVRRFHDGYRAGGGILEAGFVERPWAKRLLLRVFATEMAKELQHNIDMSVPYGEVDYGQGARGGTLVYEQPRLGGSRIGITALAGYAHRSLDFRDTSRSVYDWFGNRVFERSENAGEISAFATDLTQWEHRVLARSALTFRPALGHTLQLVAAPDFTTRTGRERLRLNRERIDPLTTRRDLFQLVSGFEYGLRDAADRLKNSAFVKHYFYRPVTDQVEVRSNSIRQIRNSMQRFGAGDALRMRLVDGLIGKLSYEYAVRLPQSDEVFGDGALVAPNGRLEPEKGHNVNVGGLLERRLGPRAGTLTADVTGFFRRTEGMIVRLLAQDRIHSIHQNVFDVRTLGADGMLRWVAPDRWLGLQTNATYLDQRNVSEEGPFAPFDGQRVPNRPWLFANASAELRIPRLGAKNAELSLSWVTRYVHEFLPGWEDTSAPNDTNRIPEQITHSFGLVYSMRGLHAVDFALDLTNLTDARVYDVLGVQRPGRAAYFKITVCWECSNGAASSQTPPS